MASSVNAQTHTTEKTFLLRPVSRSNGDLTAAWFGRWNGPWVDGRIKQTEPLLPSWQPLRLHLMDRERGPTSTLFSPGAIAVDVRTFLLLQNFPELEFLPFDLDGYGTFYLLHVIESVALPQVAQVRYAGQFGRASRRVESLPPDFLPPHRFFRFKHGKTLHGDADFLDAIFMNREGARAIENACDGYFCADEIPPS